MNLLAADIHTILKILVIGNISLSAIVLAYRGIAGQERATRVYLGAKLLQASAWVLILLRGAIPNILSVHVGNSFLVAGFSLEAIALGTAVRKEREEYYVYGIITLVAVVALAALGDTPAGRVVAATGPSAAVYLALSFFMLRRERTRLRVFIGAVGVCFAIVLSVRTVAAIRDPSFSVFSPAVIQTLSFMPLILFLIIGGAGFFFIVKERDDRLLRESEEKYRTVAENAGEAIAIIQDGIYVYANRAAVRMIRQDGKLSLEGVEFGKTLLPEDRAVIAENYSRRVAGEPVDRKYDVRYKAPDGTVRWLSVTASLVTWNSRPASLAILADIDERKRQQARIEKLLSEKELLLREVHHRVKNNLAAAIAMLSLQAGTQKGKTAGEILRDAESRLRTMSQLYESLHIRGASKYLSLRQYLKSLMDEIAILFPRDPPIRYDVELDDILLDAETLSAVGLLVNEVVTNSLKHAFADSSAPAVIVSGKAEGNRLTLTCGDNGCGLPPESDPKSGSGFGLQVISMLSRQLGATSRVSREGGTTWIFEFPINPGTVS